MDADDSIRQMAEFIAALLHRHPIDLLPYHHIAIDKYLRLGKPYRLFEIRIEETRFLAFRPAFSFSVHITV